jgi:GTP-binding protein
MHQAIVALVGRPNVGKSALFNRIVGQRRAIVEDTPGTTRDRLYGEAEWNGRFFTVVDTGGLEILGSQRRQSPQDQPVPLATASAGFIEEIRQQAEIAIAEADVIVMLVDVLDGLTAADEDVADVLRRTDKPVLVAANKADSPSREQGAFEF